MARKWTRVARSSDGGQYLDLLQRGQEFLIQLDGEEILTTTVRDAKAELARRSFAGVPAQAPAIQLAGLGMGLTLRAALDMLPSTAAITVIEEDPVLVGWCRGPLAELNGHALEDPRVSLELRHPADQHSSHVDRSEPAERRPAHVPYGALDAFVIDRYEGPCVSDRRPDDPLYRADGLSRAHFALRPDAVLGVWSDALAPAFDARFVAAGFAVEVHRLATGERAPVAYVGRRIGPHLGLPR